MKRLDKERFETKVLKTDGCWTWTGVVTKLGYGHFWLDGTNKLAHRVSYLIHKGDPTGFKVLHSCDNTLCVNPEHLRLGTQADNVRDMDQKGRRKVLTREDHGRAVMTEESVKALRFDASIRMNRKFLARKYGISLAQVNNIIARRQWQ